MPKKKSVPAEPLVSIIVPAYNHELYIKKTLESLACQTYKNIQLIVIDDGSIDKTPSIAKTFVSKNESRFTQPVFISQKNKGIASTLNKGLTLSQGKYIYLLASDDLATSNAIDILVNELEKNPEYGMACGDAGFIDKNGKHISRMIGKQSYASFVPFFTRNKKYYPIPFTLDKDFGTYESLIGGNYIPIASIIRKTVYDNIGLYNTDLSYEDYDCWIRISKLYKISFINKILSYYRTHDTNTNLTHRDKISSDRMKIHIREKDYCLKNGYKNAWDLKLVEISIGLIAKRRWAELKILISHSDYRTFLNGSILLIRMLSKKTLAYFRQQD